jgi:tRNA pseudouridine38-40 synthase
MISMKNKGDKKKPYFAFSYRHSINLRHEALVVDCAPMPTLKLTIEYKGTRYLGWQEQAKGRTIQGELRRAAEEFFRGEVDIGGSGRTDAGVHALAQTAHLRTLKKFPMHQICDGLNEILPTDIHILKVEPSSERFHARHSAVARYYLYQISTRRTAFAKDYVWWVKGKMDVKAMENALNLFCGRHDFRSFTERANEQGSTIVELTEARIVVAQDLILIRLGASHYLWKMVRRIVGVVVRIGLGELETEIVRQFLSKNNESAGPWTAPASGLFLERVLYSEDSPPGKITPAIPVFTP